MDVSLFCGNHACYLRPLIPLMSISFAILLGFMVLINSKTRSVDKSSGINQCKCHLLSLGTNEECVKGSRDGVVVVALASHPRGAGSIKDS